MLLETDTLGDEGLTLLWTACATKSAAVAQQAAALLDELLRAPLCPKALHERLLDALTAACGAGVSPGLAALLATLTRVYQKCDARICERFVALLWQLLALPASLLPLPSREAVQAAIVEQLRGGPAELRYAAIATAAKPLEAAVRRHGGDTPERPSSAGGAATIRRKLSSGNLRKLSSGGGDDAAGSTPSSARSPPADDAHELSSTLSLADVAERLAPPTAMRLIRAIGAPPKEGGSSPKDGGGGGDSFKNGGGLAQLERHEPRLGLMALAQQLLCVGASAADPVAAADELGALGERLAFFAFVAAELRAKIEKPALEAVWASMKQPDEREAVLLWLPSALPSLAPEALSYAFVSLALTGLRWDTLGAAQFRVLEALFVHYHTAKGNLRYAAAGDAKEGGGWFSKLWKVGRKADKGERGDEELIVEAMPSSLTGMRELWLAMTVAPEESRRLALPLLVKLHLRPAAALDLSIVRHELLQGAFHALQRIATPAGQPSTAPGRPPAPSARAQSQARLLLELVDAFVSACGEHRKLLPHRASWRGQSCKLAVTVEIAGEEEGASPTATAAPTAAAEAPTAAAAEAPRERGHRRSQSAGDEPTSPASVRPSTTGNGGGAAAAPSDEPGATVLELLVHDNLTLGLLRRRLKRELAGVAGVAAKATYRTMAILSRGEALEGETRTLRELRVGDALVVRLDPRKEHVGKGEGRETKAERRHALPAVLIAASNFYTDVLFAVLRAFARCKEVVAPAWALLLRVPTHVGRLQALQRPEAVDWRAEVDVLERQPMRALYTMQVVCAKLLPVEVPHDSYGAAVQQMASWKARFMAHGFVTLFETFVALASMARSDSLHMTMLTTSLSVVKACLVGYLHANNGASIAASLGAGATPRTPPLKAADGDAPPRPEVLRSGSLSAVHLRGFSLKDGRRPSKAASPTDGTPPRPGLADEALAPWPLEPEAFWALARLLVQLATAGPPAHAPAEQRRQAALDVLKLLDAVLCCHPPLVAPFLALPALPRALTRLLIRQREVNVRRQASLLVQDVCLAQPAAVGRVLALLEAQLPHAVDHAATSAEFWELLSHLLAMPAAASAPPSPPPKGGGTSASDGHARLCGTLLGLALGYPRALRDEKVVLGLLALLATLARTSASCAALVGARLGELCASCVVGAGGDAQPSTAVRHAGIGLLLATVGADGGQRSLGALLPVVDEMHARDASDEWGFDPAGDLRKTHVGLVNQGATCYMNSLLQQLFMSPRFRDGLLDAAPPPPQRTAVFSELQRAFAHMRDGLLPVYDAVELVRACEEMPLSYGAFQQNDAAEFLMLLAAHLEEALKGTAHAALLSQCFGGKMVNQVIWDEGGARKVSEREEDFVQIELQVKGHESIERALDTMILGEMLEGDNAYQIEGGGKVDAQMRKCLGELPRTLIIQLKRFELDFETMNNIKLNSAVAFPTRLDLEPYTKAGLEARATAKSARGPPRLYDLAGVLVHAGTSGFGHYFSYVKSRERGGPMNAPAGTWLTFNDRAVTGFDASQVGEQCFGGQRQIPAAGGQTQMVDKPQNGFLLFYTAAEAEAPPRMQHRRSRSEPPKNLRLSPQSDHGVPSPPLSRLSPGQQLSPDQRLSPEASPPATRRMSPLPRSVVGGGAGAPVEVVSVSVAAEKAAAAPRAAPSPASREASLSGGKRSPGGKLAAVYDAVAEAEDAASRSPPSEAAGGEGSSEAIRRSVAAANAQLVLRQQLYDATYVDFLLQLMRASKTEPSSVLPPPPPPPSSTDSADGAAAAAAAAAAVAAATTRRAVAARDGRCCSRLWAGRTRRAARRTTSRSPIPRSRRRSGRRASRGPRSCCSRRASS